MLTVGLNLAFAARPPAMTRRAVEVASMFGLALDDDDARRVTIIPPTEAPLPVPGPGVMLITGASGSGKSSLLRLITQELGRRGLRVIGLEPARSAGDATQATAFAGDAAIDDLCVIDLVAPDRPLDESLKICALAGLSDAFVLLRRPQELSDGQRFRFGLARAMAAAMSPTDYAGGTGENTRGDADGRSQSVIVIDEFAATLDRITARALARNVRRWSDRTGVAFILATTHDDLVDALDPDVLIHKGLGSAIEIAQRPSREGHTEKRQEIATRSGSAPSRCASASPNNAASAPPDAAREMLEATVESGTLADFRALAGFHYRSHHAGAATSVLRIVHRAPTTVGKFLSRPDHTQVIGVLVRSLPALACGLRDVATGQRYAGHLQPRERAMLLNREVRCISRVVVDPRLRGLGLAVRLVRHALDHPESEEVIFTEALAAMGRVSPFFERAGMTRFDRPQRARPAHARMLDALERAGMSAADLASPEDARRRLAALPAADRAWMRREFQRFLRSARRVPAEALRDMSDADLVRATRERLLFQPVYFLFAHDRAPPAHPSARKD